MADGQVSIPCQICGSTNARLTSGGKWWCLSCGFLYS
jgi:transposase